MAGAAVWTVDDALGATGTAAAAVAGEAAGVSGGGATVGDATAAIGGAGGAGVGGAAAPPDASGTTLTAISDPFRKMVTLNAPLGEA